MAKYNTLIFDLDDTLIDNEESIKYAFYKVLNKLGIEYNENLLEKWLKFDRVYWSSWEKGNMIIPSKFVTLEDKVLYLRTNRFIQFFETLKLDFATAIKVNDLYCSMLGVNIVEIPGAKKLLQELDNQYAIWIATNGPKNVAYIKLEKTALTSYIKGIVSSEEIGSSKTSKKIFNYLFAKIETKAKEQMLLIGDSLTTDILGGMKSGIDTCWYNSNYNPLPEEYNPTMTINKLLELKKKL